METNNSRRTFLGICLGGLGAVAAAAVSWPLLRYLAPRSNSETAGKIVIADTDVREGEAKFFEYAGSSAVLVRKRGGDLVAFSAVCTHLGCMTAWKPELGIIACPCHGSKFTREGKKTDGPAPRPLPWLRTWLSDDGDLMVDRATNISAMQFVRI